MYLQKLEIQGFKSFGYKTAMEFKPGITCIVGPNGSGKSNIADAVRWVMGEQSIKLLRGKKSDDVIFAGSSKKTRLSLAEVSLHINNEDHAMPIDYGEVVITRRIYRNGEGEYLINKNPVRLQDVALLLARSNFGQKTYAVIGQGMIDSVLSASPTERKNLFDEAAGVRQFQIKKEQAILKLDRTKENLKQADILIQEIGPRVRSLTRQVRKLEKREEIEKNLREIQTKYFGILWQDIFVKHNHAQKEFFDLEKNRHEAQNQVEALQKELSSMEKEGTRTEIFNALQKEYQEILNRKNSLLQEEAVLSGQEELDTRQEKGADLVFLQKKYSSLKKELSTNDQDLKELEIKLQENQQILAERTKHQQEIISACEKINHEIKIAKEKLENKLPLPLSEIQEELNQIYILQQDLIKKISEIKDIGEIENLKKEALKITQRIEVFQDKLKKSAPKIDPKDILILQEKLTDLLKQRDNLVNEVNEIKTDLKIREGRKEYLIKRADDIQKEYEEVKRELERHGAKTKEEFVVLISKQKEEIKGKINETDGKLKGIQTKIDRFNEEEQAKKNKLFSLQKDSREKQNILNEISNKVNNIRVELARFETKKEDLEHEIKEEMPEEYWQSAFQYKVEGEINTQELSDEILRMKHQMELIGGIDEGIQKEYHETKERFDFLSTQSKDLNEAILKLEKVIEDLEETIKKQFAVSFEKIGEQFGKYFRTLFLGGQAKLTLQKEFIPEEVEEIEETEEEKSAEGGEEKPEEPILKKPKGEKVVTGIEIYACPPGKKLKNITMLSGGERALTSIALLFAIISNNPSPFIVLDEVDAALDEANSQRFSAILADFSKKTQFITITHNRTTMEKGRILYGVTMNDEGVSKLLSIKMEEAEKVIERYGNRR